MTTLQTYSNPRMMAAIDEITGIIRSTYPDTTFTVDVDVVESQESVFVTAVVDVDDPDEVVDCFIDRVLALQIDEGLPLHVVPIRTPDRRDRLQATLGFARKPGPDSVSAVS